MNDSSICECGHSKSDHVNVKCKYLSCQCIEFKTLQELPEKKDNKKSERESKSEFEIDAKIFKEFHGAGKRKKPTV